MVSINRANTPFEVAKELLNRGFTVIPSGGGDDHKAPLVTWVEWQKKRPTLKQLEQWECELHPKLWGIVTGAISGNIVIDTDTPEAREEFTAQLGNPHCITPREGGHWYCQHPGFRIKTVSAILPGVDIRGDGGFVNVAGKRLACTEDGVFYPDADYAIITLPGPDNLIPWEKLSLQIRSAVRKDRSTVTIPIVQQEKPISNGKRNASLTSLAGTMRRRGMTEEAITAGLQATPCETPLPEDEIRKIAASVCRYEPSEPHSETREGIINLIRAYSGVANTISIPRVLLDLFGGDYPSAIVCNQLLYWQGKQGRSDGGIYKTYKEWESETGLSEYQIRCAAKKLKERGFLETRLHRATGAPTVTYYFNVATFSESILEFLQNPNLSIFRIHGKETTESLTENTSDITP